MQRVARKVAHETGTVLASHFLVLIISESMPVYRGPQLFLWACAGAALQAATAFAPTPSRKLTPSLRKVTPSSRIASTPAPRTSLLTAKAATEGAEIPYELCCQALHDDEAARLAAPPEDILKARYSAYIERKPDFIIDTTHPSNEEYDEDRDAWRARSLDFAAAAKFLQLVIYDSVPVDEETHSITWNARIKVLDGLVDERLVETKDFVERSLFVKEDGRWLYLKGDPDFEPRNIRVDGPLDPKPKPPKRRSTAKKPAVSRSRAPVSR